MDRVFIRTLTIGNKIPDVEEFKIFKPIANYLSLINSRNIEIKVYYASRIKVFKSLLLGDVYDVVVDRSSNWFDRFLYKLAIRRGARDIGWILKGDEMSKKENGEIKVIETQKAEYTIREFILLSKDEGDVQNTESLEMWLKGGKFQFFKHGRRKFKTLRPVISRGYRVFLTLTDGRLVEADDNLIKQLSKFIELQKKL